MAHMSKTSIKVQYVNQPKSPKGPGTVKTDTGVYYKVWPHSKNGGATLSQFEAGKTYEIEFDTEQYNGKDTFTARKILSSSESVVTGNGGNGAHTPSSSANDDRSARIERQAALKVAVQFLSIQVQTGDSKPTLKRLFELTDEIVGNINGDAPATAPVEQQEVEI